MPEIIETIKANVETIGRNFEEFKAAHTKALKDNDVLLKEKIQNLSDEISAKHAAVQQQLDALEAIKQRPLQPVEDIAKAHKAAELFSKMRVDVQAGVLRGENGGIVGADGCATSPEAVEKYAKAWRQWARKGEGMAGIEVMKDMSVGSDPDGGYFLAPPTIADRVVQRTFETSPIRAVASVMTIGTREYVVPEDPNEVGAGWVSERATRVTTASSQIARKTIVAQELYAEPAVTQQMLEDSLIPLEEYLATKISDKLGRVENTGFVSGDGNGKPRGFLTYANGTNWGQIEQIKSTSNGAFTYGGLINLITGIKDVYQGNASFLIRRQSIASIMTLVDGNGRLIFQPILNGSFNNTPLLGYTVRYAADMPAVANGALAMAFGDFKAGYQIVDRVGISMIRDNLTSKPNVLFYTRKRVGGDVIDFDAIKLHLLSA